MRPMPIKVQTLQQIADETHPASKSTNAPILTSIIVSNGSIPNDIPEAVIHMTCYSQDMRDPK
jgi:hypothetical protein